MLNYEKVKCHECQFNGECDFTKFHPYEARSGHYCSEYKPSLWKRIKELFKRLSASEKAKEKV